MCWNPQVSMNTFLLGLFGVALAAFNKYDPLKLVYIMSFVSMQLVEFFLWVYLKNKRLNQFFSVIAFSLVMFQPIAAALLLYRTSPRAMMIIITLYLSTLLLIKLIIPTHPKTKFLTTIAPNGHLLWNWLTQYTNPVLVITYMITVFTSLALAREWLFFTLAAITLAISVYTYYKDNTWGSMWCWISNIIILIIIAKIVFYDAVCKP